MYSCITEGYFAFGEDTYILRLTSKLVVLRMWYAKRIRRARLAEPHLAKLRKYDARCASYLRRDIEVVITRRSWKLLVFIVAISRKPLILLRFLGVPLHFARSLSRSFLAIFSHLSRNFLQFFCNIRSVSNPFLKGRRTIRDNLITYGGISKRS